MATATTSSEAVNVAASTSSQQLMVENVSRIEDTLVNDSTSDLYIFEGTGQASTTRFTYLIPGKTDARGLSYYVASDWKGAVQGVWASATGAARITKRSAR